jgi:hypothetical protein
MDIQETYMFHNYVVQDLLTFTEADIKDLGVKNSAHRARVVSSLVALRTKQGKGRLHGSSLLSFPLLRQILERMRTIILFISDSITMAVCSKRTPGEQ